MELLTNTCDYCKKPQDSTWMPFRCRYCGGLFCPDHRIPEAHACVVSRKSMNVPTDAAKVRVEQARETEEFEILGPLHFKRREPQESPVQGHHVQDSEPEPSLVYSTPRKKRTYAKVLAALGILHILGGIGYGYFSEQLNGWLSGQPAEPIDATWVNHFFSAVNQYRVSQGLPALQESSTLDQFASTRFVTASSNYSISHYGYDHDASCYFVNCIPISELGGSTYVLNQNALDEVIGQGAYYELPADFSGSYWPITVGCPTCSQRTIYFTTESAISTYIRGTFGSYTTVTFNSGGSFQVQFPTFPEEEILFPSGFSPAGYVNYTQEAAPIHWQGFLDGSLHSFGYYVGQGSDYEVLGACLVTEIPGPNINIPQFYAQHGCQYEVETVTWLVIEMS